jgi:hypothetical protein
MSRESMVYLQLVGIYTVCVLMPLVPAILIYRLFPSTGVAISGPLANLSIRASGAFAAYLIVFIVSYPLVQTTKETIGGFQRQFWTVNGAIKLVSMNGKEITSNDLLNKMDVRTDPKLHVIGSHVRLRVVEGSEGDLPLITVEIPRWGRKDIDLRSISVSIDKYRKTIDLREPIVIQEETPSPTYQTITLEPQSDDGRPGNTLGGAFARGSVPRELSTPAKQ